MIYINNLSKHGPIKKQNDLSLFSKDNEIGITTDNHKTIIKH